MKETDLHFFIDSTLNYFDEVTDEKAVTGIPYIKSDEPVVLDYTGIIGISGKLSLIHISEPTRPY